MRSSLRNAIMAVLAAVLLMGGAAACSSDEPPNPAKIKYDYAIVVDCDKLNVRLYRLTGKGAEVVMSIPGITLYTLQSQSPEGCYATATFGENTLYNLDPVGPPTEASKWLPYEIKAGYPVVPGSKGAPGVTAVEAKPGGYAFPNDGTYITGLPKGLK